MFCIQNRISDVATKAWIFAMWCKAWWPSVSRIGGCSAGHCTLALEDEIPLHVYVLCSDHSLEYPAWSHCHEVFIQQLMTESNIPIGNRLLLKNASSSIYCKYVEVCRHIRYAIWIGRTLPIKRQQWDVIIPLRHTLCRQNNCPRHSCGT